MGKKMNKETQRITKKVGNHVVFPPELVGVTISPDNELMHQILAKLAKYEDLEEAGQIDPDFDKTEYDFLMDCKQRGVEITAYIKGETDGQYTGKIISFGKNTILLDQSYMNQSYMAEVFEGEYRPLGKALVYKSAISGISVEDDDD